MHRQCGVCNAPEIKIYIKVSIPFGHLMFVPFISKSSPSRLFRRKGGGGKGSSGKSIGSKSVSPIKGTTIGTTSPGKTGSISSSSVTRKTTTYGNTIVAPRAIPAGQPYAGRIEGGAGRSQIFGTRLAITPLESIICLTCILKDLWKRLSWHPWTGNCWSWLSIYFLANRLASGCRWRRCICCIPSQPARGRTLSGHFASIR